MVGTKAAVGDCRRTCSCGLRLIVGGISWARPDIFIVDSPTHGDMVHARAGLTRLMANPERLRGHG
ncbi:hypothetical protein EV644_123100 [Kribbella orskensis]|uniref:Uncharacterized protein n=1 Tax=Kribbella orskensis TaxID=2512216 RepID=A0ABY2BAG8_9ACTN|nr:hypothetical protein EV642_12523 [Kribbella sp. VKM Ac-2500]TCO13268.1 hypothetical protein EV644_123100 [Kribbella orskensis]